MRKLLHFLIFILGSIVVMVGCTSTTVEPTIAPTAAPEQEPASDADSQQANSATNANFVFYDSFADW